MIGGTNASMGGSVNFRVIGGTSRPSSPRENDIWCNTSNNISGYSFSPTAPTSPADGVLWIRTSSEGPVSFNALKKQEVIVHPSASYQYISGSWQQKTSEIFVDGTWKTWVRYLYFHGNQFNAITGGWSGPYSILGDTAAGVAVGKYLNKEGIISTGKSIDITPFNELKIHITNLVTVPSGSNAELQLRRGGSVLRKINLRKSSYSDSNYDMIMDIRGLTGQVTVEVHLITMSNEGGRVEFNEVVLQ